MWNDLSGQVLVKYLLNTFNIHDSRSCREPLLQKLSKQEWGEMSAKCQVLDPEGVSPMFLSWQQSSEALACPWRWSEDSRRCGGWGLGLLHDCVTSVGCLLYKGWDTTGCVNSVCSGALRAACNLRRGSKASSPGLSSGYLSSVSFSPSHSLFSLPLPLFLRNPYQYLVFCL